GCPADGGGQFQFASADGSKVFFTDSNRLTSDAGRGGADLYECEVVEGAAGVECALHDLTPARGGESMHVDGQLIGASEDGSYLYFVADGVLAAGAVHGNCSNAVGEGHKCNLYVDHAGTIRLVTVLGEKDSSDWSESLGSISARVS